MALVLLILLLYAFVFRPWRADYWEMRMVWAAEKSNWSEVWIAAENARAWGAVGDGLEILEQRARFANDSQPPTDLKIPEEMEEPQVALALAEMVQAAGRWEEMPPLLARVVEFLPSTPRTILLHARQALHEQRIDDALNWSDLLQEVSPGRPETLLLVGKVKLASGDPFSVVSAQKDLLDAASTSSPEGLEATRILIQMAQSGVLPGPQWRDLADRIELQNGVGINERLTAASLRWVTDPDNREGITASVKEALGEEFPLEVAAWMLDRGSFGSALALLDSRSPAEEDDRPEIAIRLRMASLLNLSEIDEAYELLRKNPQHFGNSEEEYIRLLLLRQQSDIAAIDFADQADRVLLAIRKDGTEQLTLAAANLLFQLRQWKQAAEAFAILLESPIPLPVQQAAIRDRLTCLIQAEAFERAHDFGEAHFAMMPDSPIFLNNFAYNLLLLNRDTERAGEILEKLVQDVPNLLPVRSTLAFYYWRIGQPEAGLRIFETLSDDLLRQIPVSRVIAALLHHELGNPEQSRSYREQIDLTVLLAPERALLDQLENRSTDPVTLELRP